MDMVAGARYGWIGLVTTVVLVTYISMGWQAPAQRTSRANAGAGETAQSNLPSAAAKGEV